MFAAAWPPKPILESLAALERPQRPGLRWTPWSQWHVTLRFFGEIDVEEGVVAGQRVAEAAKLAAPVLAELGPAVSALGRGVIQVPVAGLEPLASALVARSAEIGQPPGPRPFVGHITLARHRGKERLDGLLGEAVSGRWWVDEIALVASVSSGRPGVANTYEVVATFPLGG